MVELAEFARQADLVEAELRALGVWQADPLAQETIDNGGAFGMNTMAFTQWLQFVLVPRLRDVAEGSIPVPPVSQLGAHASREFDGWHEAAGLVQLLVRLDDLVHRSR